MDGIVFRREEGDWRDSIKKSNATWIGRIRDGFCFEAINIWGHGEDSVLMQTLWTHLPGMGSMIDTAVQMRIPTMLKRIFFDRFSKLRDVAVKFN